MSLIEIVLKLRANLEDSWLIHAFWLEGSYATGKFNDESDIDVWLDVESGSEFEVVDMFEKSLDSIVKVRKAEKLSVYSEDPKLAKAKYYLEGFSDDNRIELDIQQHGREFQFDHKKNPILIIFDKDQTIKWKP